MSSPSILRPEISVPLAGGNVTVRELPGDLALQFFSLLAKHVSGVIAPALTIDDKGGVKADVAQLLAGVAGADGKIDADALALRICDIVASVRELAAFLVTHSTEDADAMKKYGALQCLALLDAALEVNLTADHVALLKKVGGRVGAFLAAQKNDTPKSATS